MSLLSVNLLACALEPPPQIDGTAQAIEESAEEDPVACDPVNPGDVPCNNAGSIPPTGPKGGETLPGEQSDPHASAAHTTASAQGLVQIEESADEDPVACDPLNPGDGPCGNAGSIPPTGPKGGENVPGEQSDPHAAAAHSAQVK